MIKGGWVIDPGCREGKFDVLIRDGRIAAMESAISVCESDLGGMRVVDASEMVVSPGLIDIHVHLREPGQEHKETIRTGCMAAVAGGFTAVCAMPNTTPANDCGPLTASILQKAQEAGLCRVYPIGAITRGLEGKLLTAFSDMKKAGVAGFSDDGKPVVSGHLMRKALELAGEHGLPVISHCEDLDLSRGGVMNQGETSARLGFPGIPNAAESIVVMRDIALCEMTRTPLHIAHVSTAESVQAIREAKMNGIPVTAETAPHYFTLTDEAVEAYGTRAKMNPPLRSARDMEAVREGLRDGTIDVIATDHAPHGEAEKNVSFQDAPNGVIGLESSLPIAMMLLEEGVLSMGGLIEKMSRNPARILGKDNRLIPGNPADLTLIDPQRSFTLRAQDFRSKSRNTPFDGWTVKGRVVMTIVGGRIVYE